MTKFVSPLNIYKDVTGWVYDEENPQFDHFIPEFSGEFFIVDCLIVNAQGEIHPEFQKGVPVQTENLTKVGNSPWMKNS